MPAKRRHPVLALFVIILIWGAVLLTIPWAFHMGGRSTPLLTWRGTGILHTKNGDHPLWVCFFPSAHSSRLRLDGLRPSGGLQGNGCICTGPGQFQALNLSGTIYGAWLNTDNSLLRFRLIEPKVFDVGQVSGYFDLFGKWQDQGLVMSDRGEVGSRFRSGLNIEHASVTLHWADFWTCKSACASVDRPEAHR